VRRACGCVRVGYAQTRREVHTDARIERACVSVCQGVLPGDTASCICTSSPGVNRRERELCLNFFFSWNQS
jgi:hypothetical protein